MAHNPTLLLVGRARHVPGRSTAEALVTAEGRSFCGVDEQYLGWCSIMPDSGCKHGCRNFGSKKKEEQRERAGERERESRSPFNWRKQGFDSAAPQKNIQKNEKAPAAKNTQDAPAPQHEAPTHYQAAWPWPTPDHYGLQWAENLQEAYRQQFWQQQQAQAQQQFYAGYLYGF